MALAGTSASDTRSPAAAAGSQRAVTIGPASRRTSASRTGPPVSLSARDVACSTVPSRATSDRQPRCPQCGQTGRGGKIACSQNRQRVM